ncbi:hypothetical protein CRG98_010362 [Punica granatum]|uniref:non-specific serine/threonine protein kinase n=1 Tax=Punica granatum TaxID=22663 RepID=A0A2I0KL67_PUNGR|nr:hypothetical protein CRG98_010362 [Punica granatum]
MELRLSYATLFWLLCCIATTARAQVVRSNDTDRLALLEIKVKMIDPLGTLGSWNSSIHFCQWNGVTCGQRHWRVTILDLQSGELSGTISPHVGNLSFLRVLNLQNNSFHSAIPPEVGRLSRLQVLRLSNNSLSGPVPASVTHCSNLVSMILAQNMLEGKVPSNLGSLSKLRQLDLRGNNFTGAIPLSVGNLSSLEYLMFSRNNFSGTVPDTLGNLRNIKQLALGENYFVGAVPSTIFNITSMELLDLGISQLEGSLPWDMGITLPNLNYLSVGSNQFTGSIPKSISNMSSLSVFIMAANNFNGDVPSFRGLSEVTWFHIGGNNLGDGQANDLNFLCSLTNSINLRIVDISQNHFAGSIPGCIGNLSGLSMLSLSDNVLSGSLPSVIKNLINLEYLSLWGNNISGIIPPEIGGLINMKQLHLGFCKFTGQIPHTLGNLTMMTHLSLRENNLLGTIPSSFGKCQSLILLDLGDNKLSGAIPPEIMSLSSLSIYADFSLNNLTGELPVEIGNLKNLGELDLYGNKFSGEIPASLGSCISMEYLYMQDNMFTGPIPSTLSSLKGLQALNFSNNKLSGKIPQFLEDLSLTSLGLAFNDFEGTVPMQGVFANTSGTSVVGNDKLCGGLPELRLPKCKTVRPTTSRVRNVIIFTVSGILGTVLVLLLVYFLWQRKGRKMSDSGSSINGHLKVSYQSLLRATDGFSSANLIGTGSFGSVFRGVLDSNQMTVAVKVLNLAHCGASKSFMAECEALRNIRHRNLVKVITACSGFDYKGNDFKALIYEFMVNGSLDEWLHPQIGTDGEREDAPRKLSLLQRVNIATDVACAFDYLHHQSETPVVHCDLKPSNILLDDEMNGHVGDFGLVRFLPEATQEFLSNQTSSIGVRGSLGYIAPEYGAGKNVSTDGDVYSYGILILEMFTGKRPTDGMFTDGLNLNSFAKAALPEQVMHIVDPILFQDSQDQENSRENNRFLKIQECLVSIMEIGVLCSSELKENRMKMPDVVAALQTIRKKLVAAF